jgi:hypothetical protein
MSSRTVGDVVVAHFASISGLQITLCDQRCGSCARVATDRCGHLVAKVSVSALRRVTDTPDSEVHERCAPVRARAALAEGIAVNHRRYARRQDLPEHGADADPSRCFWSHHHHRAALKFRGQAVIRTAGSARMLSAICPQPPLQDAPGRHLTKHHETRRKRPATPHICSIRAVFAGCGRCWVRTNVG